MPSGKTMFSYPYSARIYKLCAVILLTSACGGGAVGSPSVNNAQFGHVFVLVEENHSYSEVVGSSAMPYLNNLIAQNGLATQYYANAHPSICNYFMLTTGQLETADDSFSGTISDDNIVRELVKAGKSWKYYGESLPSIGYTGGDVYPYFKHHDPFAYLLDVVGTSQASNLVPFSQLASDLASGGVPNFSFITPNALNDAHDGTLAQADSWLQQNIAPLLASSTFQKDGLLVIVFDESELSDLSHGGGHVAAVVISPRAKKGFQSTTLFQHQSTLKLMLSSLGVGNFPGLAAAAPDMNEFF
jgi:phosphatidylinositol-3-phosphatase